MLMTFRFDTQVTHIVTLIVVIIYIPHLK